MDTLKKTLPVTGMHCAACALTVEKTLKDQPGVKEASVNYANGHALIEYSEHEADFRQIEKAVKGIGYGLINEDNQQTQLKFEQYQARQQRILMFNTVLAIILSAPLVVLAMLPFQIPNVEFIELALSTPVVLWCGRQFFINAMKQARYFMANMDTLVALSTGIAYLFSIYNLYNMSRWHNAGQMVPLYFESAAVVITLILLGKLLEERAKTYTTGAIKKLISLAPEFVTKVNTDGTEQQISIGEVNVEDHLSIKPGERLPVDGYVYSGSSFVNESMLTGEPLAVEKTEGCKVYSGTINLKGAFIMVAEKVGGDTVLARIIKSVQEAQGSKAPVQRMADKVAGVFVPTVLIVALLTLGVWAIAGGSGGLDTGIFCAITVLVIACPCALGLATPTAVIAGIGKAAENGILIKDAEALEQIRRTDTVVFDKTGTITEGLPKVVGIAWKEGTDTELAANVLYNLEMKSEHPLAQAIVDFFDGVSIEQLDLKSFSSITGSGITAIWKSNIYFAGSEKLIRSMSIAIPKELSEKAAEWAADSWTVVWLANQFTALGAVAITDNIRPSAAYAVTLLKNAGIETWLLTGDNESTAYSIAHEAGISQYKAGASPSEKYHFVDALRKEGRIVAMAGDGINDAEALAHADISIAMGSGSDIAVDVAKITLMIPDLKKIPLAIQLSAKTVKTIRTNLFWAFFYNVIAIPVAAGALYPLNGFLINPMIAGGAMALSSISVVVNSMRLKASNIKI